MTYTLPYAGVTARLQVTVSLSLSLTPGAEHAVFGGRNSPDNDDDHLTYYL